MAQTLLNLPILAEPEGVGSDPWMEIAHGRIIGSMPENFSPSAGFLRLWRASNRRTEAVITNRDLRQRLDSVNTYFGRKADEVFIDESALNLLAALYDKIVVPTSEVDVGTQGAALARLTAANFCEVGANVIYITEAGQLFVDSIIE